MERVRVQTQSDVCMYVVCVGERGQDFQVLPRVAGDGVQSTRRVTATQLTKRGEEHMPSARIGSAIDDPRLCD